MVGQPDQESTIRDAQGNILAVYTYDGSTLKWAEQDLYGSSRVGLWSWNSTIPSKVMLPQSETDTLSDWYLLGSRDYVLTNHLGNVLSVITDKKVGVSSNNSTVDYYRAEVLSQNDYYPFGMEEPGRSMSAIPYPYAFNGKRMENVELYTSNQYDYGMRFYDARVGRFYSVDPLRGKYPELSPYQFAGNGPIKFIDFDGLEPTDPGTRQGQSSVAAKAGTEDYYNWSWNINTKTNKGNWLQGSSTMYQNGDILNTSSHYDNNKTYYPDVNVRSISGPSIGLVPSVNLDNVLTARYNAFANAFRLGTGLENSAARAEAGLLLNNFVKGSGATLSFKPTSNMSRLLGQDPAFEKLAQSFEQRALSYYKNKGTLEGFNGGDALRNLGMPYIKGTWYMHTVMGGTQQWNAQITKISDDEIRVRYMVWDHFGAGTDDARSTLPGLPSLYWLQHNSAHYYPSTSGSYAPFNWNIRVNR